MADLEDLTERLARCYTAVVYDVLREHGRPDQVLPADLDPLEPGARAAGVAHPITGRLHIDATADDTLLAWTRFLSRAPAGSVVVCQPNDSSVAHMGELSAEALERRGVRGYVVDGGCRDTAAIVERGFPVWCRYTTPRDIVGRWLCEEVDIPVTVGDVLVRPGDLVVADRDGIVVVPHEIAGPVVADAETAMATEGAVRRAIREGVDPEEAYRRHGRF